VRWKPATTGDKVTLAQVKLCRAAELDVVVLDANDKPMPDVKLGVTGVCGIDGRVYRFGADEATSSHVTPDRVEYTTDKDGRLKIEGLPLGYTGMRCISKRYVLMDPLAWHAVPGDSPVTLRVARAGSISGRLVELNGKPAVGHVHVASAGDPVGSWSGAMKTNDQGEFSFERVPPGVYSIAGTPMDIGGKLAVGPPADKRIEVAPGEQAEVTVTLTP
jgi:hypothetical protein